MPEFIPARRVYHDWEDMNTSPDFQLDTAFEHTKPLNFDPSSLEAEEPTTTWVWPAIGFLIGGILVGHWWAKRKPSTSLVGDMSGLDVLGAT